MELFLVFRSDFLLGGFGTSNNVGIASFFNFFFVKFAN